jgi:hypothetical protein
LYWIVETATKSRCGGLIFFCSAAQRFLGHHRVKDIAALSPYPTVPAPMPNSGGRGGIWWFVDFAQ